MATEHSVKYNITSVLLWRVQVAVPVCKAEAWQQHRTFWRDDFLFINTDRNTIYHLFNATTDYQSTKLMDKHHLLRREQLLRLHFVQLVRCRSSSTCLYCFTQNAFVLTDWITGYKWHVCLDSSSVSTPPADKRLHGSDQRLNVSAARLRSFQEQNLWTTGSVEVPEYFCVSFLLQEIHHKVPDGRRSKPQWSPDPSLAVWSWRTRLNCRCWRKTEERFRANQHWGEVTDWWRI